MMIKPVHSTALLLLLCAHGAQAQDIYRCGGSYSNKPCPGGTVVPIDDARSAEQRAQTEAATRRDAKAAQLMEKERLKREAEPAQATIPVGAGEPSATGDRTTSKAKLRKPELFTAVSPRKPGDAPAKKKKKAAKKAS